LLYVDLIIDKKISKIKSRSCIPRRNSRNGFQLIFCYLFFESVNIRSVLFISPGFFGLRFFSHCKQERDKKDAEASKTASSPYNCTSCGEIGRRKSENVKSHAGIRKDSCRIETGRDKKDAEALKTASSPYNCTAETVFGGRKSG